MVAIMVWSDPKINCVQSQNTKMGFNVSIQYSFQFLIWKEY